MAELKDDIGELESKIGQLRVQYEQYFMRQIKLEPLKLRDEIEKIILLHSNKPISSSTLKFRFGSAVAKYNSYKHYWNRTLRAIADGTFTGGRSETGAFSGTLLNSRPPAPSSANNAAEAQRPEPPVTGGNNHLAEVYRSYIESKRKCNEPVEGISYEAFAKTIQQSTQKAKETYKTDMVELKVTIKDGKTKLTIAPKLRQE